MTRSIYSISVNGSKTLAGVIAALKTMDRPLSAAIRKYTKAEITPQWTSDLAQHAETRTDFAVLVRTARVDVGGSAQNVSLQSATSKRRLPGGLVPSTDYAALEFGAQREKVRTYERRTRKGRIQQVTRHTARQLPPRTPKGRIVYATVATEIPRYAALWVQTTIRTFYEAVNGVPGVKK